MPSVPIHRRKAAIFVAATSPIAAPSGPMPGVKAAILWLQPAPLLFLPMMQRSKAWSAAVLEGCPLKSRCGAVGLVILLCVLPSISDIRCEVPELRGDNFKIWKERILLQLGCMDIDYAIRKDEPHKITIPDTEQILLYEREKSNRLSVMYIKTKIGLDKALASTLIMKFTSLKLTGIRGVREHIMEMRDIVAQLKKLEGMQNLRKPVTTLDAFKVFKAEVEKQYGKQIKIVRSDRGGEYYGRYLEDGQSPRPFVKFLQEHGIVAQYTMPGSPDQNGVTERRN
ncbi:hypothetical protein AAG906_002347 [Vitis piasezkii]